MKTSVQFELPDRVYQADIMLFCGLHDQLEQWEKKKFGAASRDQGNLGEYNKGKCGKNGWTTHYIWIRKWRRGSIEDRNTLAHELLHLVFQVMREKGMQLTHASEEAYTHYFEMLHRDALLKLRGWYGY